MVLVAAVVPFCTRITLPVWFFDACTLFALAHAFMVAVCGHTLRATPVLTLQFAVVRLSTRLVAFCRYVRTRVCRLLRTHTRRATPHIYRHALTRVHHTYTHCSCILHTPLRLRAVPCTGLRSTIPRITRYLTAPFTFGSLRHYTFVAGCFATATPTDSLQLTLFVTRTHVALYATPRAVTVTVDCCYALPLPTITIIIRSLLLPWLIYLPVLPRCNLCTHIFPVCVYVYLDTFATGSCCVAYRLHLRLLPHVRVWLTHWFVLRLHILVVTVARAYTFYIYI